MSHINIAKGRIQLCHCREIHVLILTNPCIKLEKYMYQICKIQVTTWRNSCNNFDKSKLQLWQIHETTLTNSPTQLTTRSGDWEERTRQGNDRTWVNLKYHWRRRWHCHIQWHITYMPYMANSNMAETAANYLKLHQNAQCMNTLIYSECLLHEDFKNIVHDGLLELYGVYGGLMDGWIIRIIRIIWTATTTRSAAVPKRSLMVMNSIDYLT